MDIIASFPRSLRSFYSFLFLLSIPTLSGLVLPQGARAQECVEVVRHELTCQNVLNAPTPVYKFSPRLKMLSGDGRAIAIAVFDSQEKIVGTCYTVYNDLPRNIETTPPLFIGGALPGEELTARIRLFNHSSRVESTDSCEVLYNFTVPDCQAASANTCLDVLDVKASCVENSPDNVAVTMRIKNLTPYPIGSLFVAQWDAYWGPIKPHVRNLYNLPTGRTSGEIEAVEVFNTNSTHDPVPFVILALKGFGDSIRRENPDEWEDTTECTVKVWADVPDCRPNSVNEPANSENPVRFFLEESAPNPTTGQVAISLRLTASERVSLVMRDVNGRAVMHLLENERLTSGTHVVSADVSALPSGTYFYTLESDSGTATRKMTITR